MFVVGYSMRVSLCGIHRHCVYVEYHDGWMLKLFSSYQSISSLDHHCGDLLGNVIRNIQSFFI